MTRSEIREIRTRLGFSAARLAQLIGVAGERTIFAWERGERPIPGTVAVLLTALSESPEVRTYFKIGIDGHAQ